MLTTSSNVDLLNLTFHSEPGLPHFLDAFNSDSDDLGDWWLDLGAVEFTSSPGM